MGNRISAYALLLSAVAFFSVLAMDIAVPATVLSIMALMRWAVLSLDDGMPMQGEAA